MSKLKIVLGVVLVLAGVAYGFFWWQATGELNELTDNTESYVSREETWQKLPFLHRGLRCLDMGFFQVREMLWHDDWGTSASVEAVHARFADHFQLGLVVLLCGAMLLLWQHPDSNKLRQILLVARCTILTIIFFLVAFLVSGWVVPSRQHQMPSFEEGPKTGTEYGSHILRPGIDLPEYTGASLLKDRDTYFNLQVDCRGSVHTKRSALEGRLGLARVTRVVESAAQLKGADFTCCVWADAKCPPVRLATILKTAKNAGASKILVVGRNKDGKDVAKVWPSDEQVSRAATVD